MSQENVEIVRRGIDAWNRGDRDAVLAAYAPDVEWHTTGRFADRGVYRGAAGVERLMAEIDEDIEQLTFSVSEVRAVGDKVFIAVAAEGRGRQSKAGFEQRYWYVNTFRDGLIVRVDSYADRTQALEAAGLSE